MNLFKTLDKLSEIQDVMGIWTSVADYMVSQSVSAYVYHHLPAPGALDYTDKYFIKKPIAKGSDRLCDIVHHQFVENFQDCARLMTRVRFWEDPCVKGRVVDEVPGGESDTVPMLPGVTVPVHGPGGRNGCFSIVLPEALRHGEGFDLHSVRWLCQSAHQSYCRILGENNADIPKLTPREVEILSWMALGKTNNEIAQCLDISSHTVSTYTRRIFLKTNTADRTSASLYGISNGLLRL